MNQRLIGFSLIVFWKQTAFNVFYEDMQNSHMNFLNAVGVFSRNDPFKIGETFAFAAAFAQKGGRN